MSRALFISDIHISSPDDERAGLFRLFLSKCLEVKPSDLFLVGDIFDLWISDRPYFVNRYVEIIALIRALRNAGVRIHYFEGNHDLDLRRFWQTEMGCEVYSEAAYFDLNGLRVRVEHGDQMDPDDQGYLFLRWFLRTRPMVWLGRLLPNSLVAKIGERASNASRKYTSEVKTATDEAAVLKIRAHAGQSCAVKPFDLFVSGHVHVAEFSQQTAYVVKDGDGGGEREFRCVNLGTWLKEPLVLDLQGKDARLVPVREFLK